MRLRTLFFATFLGIICPKALRAQEPTPVSIVSLIATPEKYHGKVLFVRGVLNIAFEGNALYLHTEDRLYHNHQNAIWLDLATANTYHSLNGQHVVLVGRFQADKQGHFKMYPGAFTDISRVGRVRKR